MEKSSKLMLMLGAMMAMSDVSAQEAKPNNECFRKPKEPIVPKGCKKYHFTRTGSIFTSHNENIVFTTIASSEKSAQKKFDKWYNQNPQPNESN